MSMFGKLKALSVLGAGLYLASAHYAVAQRADLNSPDLVLINAKVLTMDASSSVAEAIAIRDGKILAVGSSASVKALIGTQTRVFDVAGKTVVPGLIDTHAHFKAAGMTDYVVNMGRAKTVAEAIDAIKAFATVDRKSTRLNSSHQIISYAVFCLKKKNFSPCHSRPNCK